MRTLTLGVLIVAGGTLASLPFRRYQAIPDASSEPVHVTGPSQSALQTPPRQLVRAEQAPDQPQTLQTLETQLSATNLPRWQPQSPAVTPPPRSIDAPLTFDDLMSPIDLPLPIQKRFSATTPIRAEQLEQERLAGLVMPAMESLAASQVEDLQRSVAKLQPQRIAPPEKTLPQHQPTAAASLAGARNKNLQRLPAAAPPTAVSRDRQRHWIRQPD